MHPPTAKELLRFASVFEGETLVTRAQQAAFSICVVPEGLKITPTFSGKPRVVRKEEIRSVLGEYARSGSTQPADYQSLSFNSSYLLALIRLYTPFPFLDFQGLLAHRKAGKSRDLARILRSPRSEDWVTWNVLQAIQINDLWWPELVKIATQHAWTLDNSLAAGIPPSVELWREVDAPHEYECASRRRMANSNNPEWQERSDNPRPVEGRTEVDAVFKAPEYLVFVEAKLGHDISERTTYDPTRDQIVRNIDCAIEEADGRRPFFWMFVKDRDPGFKYSELIDDYRSDLSLLKQRLPHRNPEILKEMVKGLAVVEWRELVSIIPDTPDVADVLKEIRRRVE